MQSNTLYKIRLAGNSTPIAVRNPVYADPPNALAYHTGDNFMYAVGQKGGQTGQVIRITNDGVGRAVSGVTVSTTSSITSGTIDPDGYFWVAWTNAQYYAKIDLRVGAGASYGTTVLTGSTNLLTTPNNMNQAQFYQINDWAAVGPTSGDGNRTGKIYTVAGQGGQGSSTTFRSLLLSMTTANPPVWAILGTYTDFNGGTNGNGTTGRADWGAMYPTSDGYLYATENTNGRIYKFDLTTPANLPTFVIQGPNGTTNDGARCVNALIS